VEKVEYQNGILGGECGCEVLIIPVGGDLADSVKQISHCVKEWPSEVKG
jgi:hypothetical protein